MSYEKRPPPLTLQVATWGLLLSAAAYVAFTAIAAVRLDEIRSSLEKGLAQQASRYPMSDIASTVELALVSAIIVGSLLVLGELLCARALRRQRGGARHVLTVLVFVHVPVLLVTSALSDPGVWGLAAATTQGVTLVLALLLVLLPGPVVWMAERQRVGTRAPS